MITYCAFDLLKKKQYYGSTSNIKRRISSHLKNRSEGNPLFHNVLRKRPETFLWVRLCESEDRNDEQYLLNFYCPSEWVYNLSQQATGFSLNNCLGGKNKGQVCIHFLDKKQIYVPQLLLDEYLQQGWEIGIIEQYKSNYRRLRDQETRDKISTTLKGLYSTKKLTSRDQSGSKNPFFGKKHSEETRSKLSSNRGRFWVNNGKTNLFLKAGEQIPVGFTKGRLAPSSSK